MTSSTNTSSNESEQKQNTTEIIPNDENNLINFLLHMGEFSTDELMGQVNEMLPLEQMGLFVSTCHELDEADLTLYVPPTEWNDGEDARRKCKIMTVTPTTKWVGRIDTSNVTKMMLGAGYHTRHKAAVVTNGMLRCVTSGKFPLLNSLDLTWCNNITTTGFFGLIRGCPLTTLDLTQCSWVTDASMTALSDGCPQLTTLNLSNCKRITDDGAIALSNGCSQLTVLNLDACDKITDYGISVLCSIGCKKLTTLSLSSCQRITDVSVSALSHECPELATLNLCNCKRITDQSAIALSDGYPKLKLISLNLMCCDKITDFSVRVLARFSKLIDLNLNWCKKVTNDSVNALRQSHPQMNIEKYA